MTPSGAVRKFRDTARLRRARALLLSAALIASGTVAGACYKFAGGGGFPSDLKTVATVPFDNQTPSPELQRELNEFMRKSFQDRLSLRDAPEDKADVVVKGTIVQYDVDLPANISSNPAQINTARRRLQLVVNVEILNAKTGKSLLKQDGMQAEGTYAEGREPDGRKLAIETLVDQMIQRSQSQW